METLINFIRQVFFCPNAPAFRQKKKLLKMSVAATNKWYHAERRVTSKHQRRSGGVQGRQSRCRRFESFGRIFFIVIIFSCTLYNEKKNIFAIENIFKVF